MISFSSIMKSVPLDKDGNQFLIQKIVKPIEGEDEQKFMGRCMSLEKGKFPDPKQRIAVCMSKYRKGAKVTKEEVDTYFEQVEKGAPIGNQNAAGPHNIGGRGKIASNLSEIQRNLSSSRLGGDKYVMSQALSSATKWLDTLVKSTSGEEQKEIKAVAEAAFRASNISDSYMRETAVSGLSVSIASLVKRISKGDDSPNHEEWLGKGFSPAVKKPEPGKKSLPNQTEGLEAALGQPKEFSSEEEIEYVASLASSMGAQRKLRVGKK